MNSHNKLRKQKCAKMATHQPDVCDFLSPTMRLSGRQFCRNEQQHSHRVRATYGNEYFFGFLNNSDSRPFEFLEQFDSSRIVNRSRRMGSKERRKPFPIG
ncbi:UNVERIFIED_CONTAM: hypothetical protein NCL1_34899 [Trichonephila clavipes]